MAKALYTSMRSDILGILKELGTKVTVQTQTKTFSGYAVFDENVSEGKDGSSILKDTKTVYFQGKDKFEPAQGDLITFGSNVFAVVTAEAYQPDGTTIIAFKMEVKQ